MRPDTFPITVFANSNLPHEQIEHIRGEIKEFEEAYYHANNVDEAILEALDIYHSAMTLVDILARMLPEHKVWEATHSVAVKNYNRRYYQLCDSCGSKHALNVVHINKRPYYYCPECIKTIAPWTL